MAGLSSDSHAFQLTSCSPLHPYILQNDSQYASESKSHTTGVHVIKCLGAGCGVGGEAGGAGELMLQLLLSCAAPNGGLSSISCFCNESTSIMLQYCGQLLFGAFLVGWPLRKFLLARAVLS